MKMTGTSCHVIKQLLKNKPINIFNPELYINNRKKNIFINCRTSSSVCHPSVLSNHRGVAFDRTNLHHMISTQNFHFFLENQQFRMYSSDISKTTPSTTPDVKDYSKVSDSKTLNVSDDSKTSITSSTPPVVLSKKDKLKRAVKEYGATVIIFHVAISLVSLGGFYLAVSSGLDIQGLLYKIGIHNQNSVATGASTFVMAYAVHKVFAPVRISITLASTPFIVRYLRRIGILKPPKTSSNV